MSKDKPKQSTFMGHFIELRSTILKSVTYLFIFFILCFFFAENIYSFLVQPYADAVKDDGLNRRLIFTALHETFITYLNLHFIDFCNHRQPLP